MLLSENVSVINNFNYTHTSKCVVHHSDQFHSCILDEIEQNDERPMNACVQSPEISVAGSARKNSKDMETRVNCTRHGIFIDSLLS